ncbi:MAG: site-2 protease family protein [Syntrophobacterales bacterium]|jgi:Zn-dependent protease|nr:site-2 protease family protein [Syntrophobacterales bacterium]
MLLELLVNNPFTFILLIIPLLCSIVMHELAHGWAAYIMGDSTAKNMGRLTLNPLRHLDPIGTIALFIVGFGWAKPVPVNTYALTRQGYVFVAAAGVITNIILAFLAMLMLRLYAPSPGGVATFFFYLIHINITLAVLNLLPIPPLDGSRILSAYLPHHLQYKLRSIEPFGFFIIIGLVFLGVLKPVIIALANIMGGLISFLLGSPLL